MHVSTYKDLFDLLTSLKHNFNYSSYPNHDHRELILNKIKEIEDIVYQDRVDDLNLKVDVLRLAYQDREDVDVFFLHKTLLKVRIQVKIPYDRMAEVTKELDDDPIIKDYQLGGKPSYLTLMVNKIKVENFNQYIAYLCDFLKSYSE